MFVFNKFGFKGCLKITHTRDAHKQAGYQTVLWLMCNKTSFGRGGRSYGYQYGWVFSRISKILNFCG